jgi:hypothetical protein
MEWCRWLVNGSQVWASMGKPGCGVWTNQAHADSADLLREDGLACEGTAAPLGLAPHSPQALVPGQCDVLDDGIGEHDIVRAGPERQALLVGVEADGSKAVLLSRLTRRISDVGDGDAEVRPPLRQARGKGPVGAAEVQERGTRRRPEQIEQ